MDATRVPGTVAVTQFTPLLEALPALGIDAGRVLARAGLRLSEVDCRDPFARLPSAAEFRIWDALQEATGDPLIALRVGDLIRVGALGTYEYLVRNSATFRESIARANRFETLIDDLTRLELIEHKERSELRVVRRGGYPHPPRGLECFFYVLHQVALTNGFSYLPFSEVQFAHSPPCAPALFSERFGVRVRFEAEYNQVSFPTVVLDEPLPQADPRLGELLEEQLETQLRGWVAPDPFLYHARDAIRTDLRGGRRSCDSAACQLGLSARTFRRRLRQQGTSYSSLLDEVRKELAMHEVGTTDHSIAEVAQHLGFSEPSTFYRAFRRWFGTTPAAYREQLHTLAQHARRNQPG